MKVILCYGQDETGDTPAVITPAPEELARLQSFGYTEEQALALIGERDGVIHHYKQRVGKAAYDQATAEGDSHDEAVMKGLAAAGRVIGTPSIPKPYRQMQAVEIIEDTDLPDDDFREQWRRGVGGKPVDVDMPLARAEQLRRLRERRKERMSVMDAKELEAMSKNDTMLLQKVRNLKQRLRDMPRDYKATIDAANTPDELKVIEPPVLSDEPEDEAVVPEPDEPTVGP